MKKTVFSICFLLGFWLVIMVSGANSHSGHSKSETSEQKTEEPAAAGDAIDASGFYAVEGEETGSPSSPFSRTDLFSSDSMEQEGVEMKTGEHEEMEHSKHQVQLAKYEWISSSQKGYKSAVGLTVLAGILFGILSIRRKKY